MALWKLLPIVSVVLSYWAMAIAMVFINKHLVSFSEHVDDISVFVVWVQMILGVLIVYALKITVCSLRLPWPVPGLYVQQLLMPDMIMSSMCFMGTLVFNNLMLKYVSVAFYQVARSLTLMFVVTFSIFILQEKVTKKVFLSCFLIIIGFYIALDEEVVSQGLQFIGVLYGIVSSMFAAMCGVFFKRVRGNNAMSSIQLTFNNCVITSIALTPIVMSSGQLDNFLTSSVRNDISMWTLLMASGFISLTMGWISVLQITLTSPLTHNISINAKSSFQTILAVAWSGQSRARLWWVGNGFVVIGIAMYTAHKLSAEKDKTAANLNHDNKEPPKKLYIL